MALLCVALLVLAAGPVLSAEAPARARDAGTSTAGTRADSTDGSPGVCLLQRADPVFGRRSGRPAVEELAEPETKDLLVGEESDEGEKGEEDEAVHAGDRVELEKELKSQYGRTLKQGLRGKVKHVDVDGAFIEFDGVPSSQWVTRSELSDLRRVSGATGATLRLAARRSRGARRAASVGTKKPEAIRLLQFLEIRSWPSSTAPLVGMIQPGEQFQVHNKRKTSSGEVWLELSDGRGFVPRPRGRKAAVGLLDASYHAGRGANDEDVSRQVAEESEDGPEVSQDPMANGFPKEVAPKHDVDHDAMHMKKTKMSVKGLPEESSYVNHKTQTADWRNEYKWSTESPSELERSGATRALPLVVALIAVLARGVF